jgi:histidinol-phosphate aminotransferase
MIEARSHLRGIVRRSPVNGSRRGCLRLDLNENPDGLPEEFVRSVLKKVDGGYLSTYPEYDGVIYKIAEHNGLKPENICLANGSDGVIRYIFDAFVDPGNEILLTEPTFAMYPVYCKLFQANVHWISYNTDFTFPLDLFLEAVERRPKLAVMVNPNNPTGVAVSKTDLVCILEKCAEYNVIFVVDEAYFYYFDETVIKLVEKYPNLIVLRTFSKLCAMAALRIGYAAASPSIIESLRKVKSTFDVNGLAVMFVEKLLDNGYVIEYLISQVNEGKRFLLNKLTDTQISYRDGMANFVLIKCPDMTEDIVLQLAERNILVAAGFQQEIMKDYLRVTVGSVKIMTEFWAEFQQIMEC